ncbi:MULTISPECIES: nitroreductase/quinone reductase family protein [Pseudofrankia]|uniref:nitroreductase/quinone reductase family protein n=1 Tax=Pseudofrankia TaxID=2994363 RepID=UPI000234BEEB|nr:MULTISPECIES: nitroreductase/quinone reductase family protein [Pseudofrankia]
MSFDTQNGTRGARQPGKWVNLPNKLMAKRIRKGGQAMNADALVLTTVGRRTGTARETPVACFPGGEFSWFIVASAAGAARNPAWYYNLAAHPDEVQVETAGRKVAVTAEQLHGRARDSAWQQITAASPRFAQYQQKTDRELPVIRLIPRAT